MRDGSSRPRAGPARTGGRRLHSSDRTRLTTRNTTVGLYWCKSRRPTCTTYLAPSPITLGATSSAARSRPRRASSNSLAQYPMSFAAVRKHIAILERAGLVSKERVGRRKVVRTNLERLRVVRHLLDEYEELWRGRIDRMDDLIADTKEHGQ